MQHEFESPDQLHGIGLAIQHFRAWRAAGGGHARHHAARHGPRLVDEQAPQGSAFRKPRLLEARAFNIKGFKHYSYKEYGKRMAFQWPLGAVLGSYLYIVGDLEAKASAGRPLITRLGLEGHQEAQGHGSQREALDLSTTTGSCRISPHLVSKSSSTRCFCLELVDFGLL